jgi:glutamyl-tRNA reductase
MHYLIISFTHKNTDISTREKLAFGSELEKESFLKKSVDCMYINEAILLSTCNRVEVIASTKDTIKAKDTILKNFASKSGLKLDELMTIADAYEDENAIFHLFSVASSIDSLVVGETQIAGQLKDAYKFAQSKGYCSMKLSRAINYSFKCAGVVRNETTLGTGSVSVSSTAVAKAKQIFTNPSEIEAVVVGAGEMSELCVKHLLKSGFKVILISRDIKKSTILASNIGGDIEVQPYCELETLLNTKQLLFTATSAPYPIIKKEMIYHCDEPRYWFDIAIPRDIEQMDIVGVSIFSVDDLKGIVDENMAFRAQKAKKAYKIVQEMTKTYFQWLNTLGVEPIIKGLFTKGDAIIETKINDAIKKGYIENSQKENIDKLCHSILAKYLFETSKNLRILATKEESDTIFESVQNIFNIKIDEDTQDTNYKCISS